MGSHTVHNFYVPDPIQYTLSIHLDRVLLWPDDGCFTVETCCLKVNDKLMSICLLYVLCL